MGLALHPDKTRLVYCKDGKRRGDHEHTSFTFLGFHFRARKVRSKDGRYFTSFVPAMSPDALKAKGAELRTMRVHLRTYLEPGRPGAVAEPHRAGWMTYYGRFYRSADAPPPPARQHLPEALGWEEVPAVAGLQAVQAVVGRADRSTARPVRPMAVGSCAFDCDG